MGKNKKKFIDKKNAITFSLVHRSQRDPLIADETAPQHVLLANEPNRKDKEKRIDEQHKYGVYFDDDYDYLQHLRGRDELNVTQLEKHFIPAKPKQDTKKTDVIIESTSPPVPAIKLPSSVFESHIEEDIGMLNKAAPEGLRLDLDPDIVAAMDEDFDYDNPDNILEDDFIQMANGGDGGNIEDDIDEEGEYESMSSDFDEEDDEFDENDEKMKMFMKEETKSRFTEYSMSSSVIRRNQNLAILDDTFEQLYAKYDDNEIGALDCEEIEGEILTSDQRLLQVAEEFAKEQQEEKFSTERILNQYGRIYEESETESSEDEYEKMVVKEKEKWDCESILSTYSNIYNHPTLISEPKVNKIKINPKTGVPITGVSNKLTVTSLAHHDDMTGTEKGPGLESIRGPGSIISAISTLSIRPKDESPEDRRNRKKALREFRKERRIEKKLNREAFKDEKKRMEKSFINKKTQSLAIHL